MTRASGGGESITWRVVVGGIGSVLVLLLVFLLNSTANRISTTKDQLEDARREIVGLQGKMALLVSRAGGCESRMTALEAKLDRVRNPRPWEAGQTTRRIP
jgi:hypothetical protein